MRLSEFCSPKQYSRSSIPPVPAETVPTVPVSGSGSAPGPPWDQANFLLISEERAFRVVVISGGLTPGRQPFVGCRKGTLPGL